MRRLFIHLVLMVITFGLGWGVDWLVPKRVNKTRPADKVKVVVPKVVEARPGPPVLATPTQHLIFDYNASKVTPDGVYFINGPTPHEFREFNSFDLSSWSAYEFEQQLSGYVGIQTYSNNVYSGLPAIFALVTERRLFFLTSRDKNGIEYRFDGEFIRDPASHANKNVSVLSGKLIKAKNGRKIAERKFNFRVYSMGC